MKHVKTCVSQHHRQRCFDYLRNHAIAGKVNFWIPSAPAHKHVDAGMLWLFKPNGTDDVIADVAMFRFRTVLPLQLT
jgi:hypothetical protein